MSVHFCADVTLAFTALVCAESCELRKWSQQRQR